MYTASDAYAYKSGADNEELDRQIKAAVQHSEENNRATLRVWDTDWFANTIKEELEMRGFKNISGYKGSYKWDVYFEW